MLTCKIQFNSIRNSKNYYYEYWQISSINYLDLNFIDTSNIEIIL